MHHVRHHPVALAGVRIVELSTTRTFPRHAHDDYGVGVMLCGGHKSWSGRGAVEAGPNDVITVSPNEIHDGLPVDDQPRKWRMLFVDPTVVADCMGRELAAREFSIPAETNPLLSRRILCAMHALTQADTAEPTAIVADLFGELLDEPLGRQSGRSRSLSVMRMLERIHDAPAARPSLAELAAAAGLSPYTALRRFRRELGITPHAYLIQYRVRQASNALFEGVSLAEASLSAGFADQSHMSRAFVRQFGITPGQWRSGQYRSRSAQL